MTQKEASMLSRTVLSISIVAVWLILVAANPSYAQESFYKGKTLTFVVGASPGGGFDVYTRIIARYMSKYIPGSPSILVQNMTGAGTLIAANHTYGRANPDGLTIGVWVGSLTLQKYLGATSITFDPMKFEWIGVPVQQTFVCAFTKASGITSMDKWFGASRPVKIGGQAPGTRLDDIPMILKTALGLPVQLIQGYKGTADVVLAADSGEVDGICTSWQGTKTSWRRQIESGNAVVVLQTNPKSIPELSNVPLAINFAKSEEARRLIQVGIHDVNAVTLAYSAPPGTPKERVQVLRKAFVATLKDPEFLSDAKKADLEVDPMTGEELQATIAGFQKLPPQVMARLKEILLPKK
jgi:tripartite-type tricarboxylate transporter receptor subunit TctC